MSGLPTPYRVMVRERQSVGADDFGNDKFAWAETSWDVHAIQPGAMAEPAQANRDLSIVAWTIYGPKSEGYPRTESAEVKIPGDDQWFKVDGLPDDWTLGPWKHPTAGIVVELRRADH